MLRFSGQLYGSDSGYLLLQVPNALAIGCYRALPETGLVLPKHDGRPFNAHITVMRPDEVAQAGGLQSINERGKHFEYSIEGADTAASPGATGPYSRYWFIRVRSAGLSQLRRTYGLQSESDVPFHITFAARPRLVLRENGVSKLSAILDLEAPDADERQYEAGESMELVHPGNHDLSWLERHL